RHARVRHDRVLEINRADPFAAGLDQILGAVGDAHVAVGIDAADVAGAQPAIVAEAAGIVDAVVAGGDERPAHLDLTHLVAVPRRDALVAHDTQLHQRHRHAGGGVAPDALVLGRVVELGLLVGDGAHR